MVEIMTPPHSMYLNIATTTKIFRKKTTNAGSICDRRFSVFLRSSSSAMVRTRTISSRSVEYFSSILNIVSTMLTFLHKQSRAVSIPNMRPVFVLILPKLTTLLLSTNSSLFYFIVSLTPQYTETEDNPVHHAKSLRKRLRANLHCVHTLSRGLLFPDTV